MADCSPQTQRSYQLAKSLRNTWEGRWQNLYDVAMPYRTSFFSDPGADAGAQKGRVYDETGLVGIEEFANRLQTGIVPSGVEWARLDGPQEAEDGFRAGLRQVQGYMFRVLDRTNFATEISDAFKDLAGPGNMCLRSVPGDWQQPIRFQAIPLADVWITPGANGNWADIHVRYRLPAYAAEAQFGVPLPEDAKADGTRMISVVDSWLRDLAAPNERWMREIHLEGKHCLVSREVTGAGSCEYVFARWSKESGELYGRGQGMMALPAIEVSNEVVRLILSHGEMALAGMWQAEDDGVLNPYAVRLVPGTIIPIAPGSGGLKPLQLPSTKLDIGQLVLEEQRHAIRKALYNETLGPRQGTPPTAMEIQERMAELARQIGPSYGRVWQEAIVPLLVRMRYLLERKGLITMPMIDGQKVRVVASSSLVRAAAMGDVRRINEWMSGIAAHYGPPAVASLVPADRYMRLTAEKMDIPADLPFSPTEVERNAQAAGTMLGLNAAGGGEMPGGDALAPLLAALAGGGAAGGAASPAMAPMPAA